MTAVVPVSVVIPCYGCASTIARALASVAEQTVLPREVILVDDGSTDNTREVLRQLVQKYPKEWVQLVLLDSNVGAASARNEGWSRARGEFVAFLDADDSWHPLKLELQHQFMVAQPHIAVSGHGHAQLVKTPLFMPLGVARFQPLSRLYLLLKNPFITPSFMVRRDLPFRFLTGRRYMEDHYFLMQLAVAGLGIARTKLPLAYIYKPIYGDSGLSANLEKMHASEQENYRLLQRAGYISFITTQLLLIYSRVKYLRRILIVMNRP